MSTFNAALKDIAVSRVSLHDRKASYEQTSVTQGLGTQTLLAWETSGYQFRR